MVFVLYMLLYYICYVLYCIIIILFYTRFYDTRVYDIVSFLECHILGYRWLQYMVYIIYIYIIYIIYTLYYILYIIYILYNLGDALWRSLNPPWGFPTSGAANDWFFRQPGATHLPDRHKLRTVGPLVPQRDRWTVDGRVGGSSGYLGFWHTFGKP